MTSPETSAALKGATLAFNGQKTDADTPKPKPKPALKMPNLKTTDNGALSAATFASRDHSTTSSRPRSPTSPSGKTFNNAGSRGISRQTTGGSVQEYGRGAQGREFEHRAVSRKLSQYLASSPGSPYHLSPGGRPGPDQRSASFIAATLAASRSASPSPHHTGQGYFPHAPQSSHSPLNPNLTRRRSIGASSVDSSAISLDLPDTSSIPPTNSLISMFEQHGDIAPVKDPVKKSGTSPEQVRATHRPKLRARTPPESLSPGMQVSSQDGREVQGQSRTAVAPPTSTHPRPEPKPLPTNRSEAPPRIIRRAATQILSPESRKLGPKPDLQPPAVRPRATVETLSTVTNPPAKRSAQEPKPSTSSTLDEHPATVRTSTEHLEPASLALSRRTSTSSASSDDTFVSASSTRSPRPGSPTRGRERPTASEDNLLRKPAPKPSPVPPKPPSLRRASSMHINPRPPPSRPLKPLTRSSFTALDRPNASTSTLPLDSLTNAIMASNLAANRAPPSPNVPPPLPAPRRHNHRHLHLHHHNGAAKKHHTGDSGRTSPQRPTGTTLLTTLRQPPTASEEDEDAARRHHRRKRKPLQSKKKHAHHEGARKRWRDEVTPRERKRYEAVWASNRGLLFGDPPEAEADQAVVNVVVRDIWARSRLPFDELAEVWDLVYHGRPAGGLNREEFVVGMWLIDQRLRGRKIPARVSDSVWDSARGMRVKAPKGKK